MWGQEKQPDKHKTEVGLSCIGLWCFPRIPRKFLLSPQYLRHFLKYNRHSVNCQTARNSSIYTIPFQSFSNGNLTYSPISWNTIFIGYSVDPHFCGLPVLMSSLMSVYLCGLAILIFSQLPPPPLHTATHLPRQHFLFFQGLDSWPFDCSGGWAKRDHRVIWKRAAEIKTRIKTSKRAPGREAN